MGVLIRKWVSVNRGQSQNRHCAKQDQVTDPEQSRFSFWEQNLLENNLSYDTRTFWGVMDLLAFVPSLKKKKKQEIRSKLREGSISHNKTHTKKFLKCMSSNHFFLGGDFYAPTCKISLHAVGINDQKIGHYWWRYGKIMSELLSQPTHTEIYSWLPFGQLVISHLAILSHLFLFFYSFSLLSISLVISTLQTIQGQCEDLNCRVLSFPGFLFSFEETFSPLRCLYLSFHLLTNCSLILTLLCYHSTAGLFQGQT